MGNRSAIISVPRIRIFVDGLPSDHECDSNGDMFYETVSGKRITWNTHKEWAYMTTMARQPIIFAHYDKLLDPIVMASGSCSKCKSVAVDAAPWL